MNSTFARQLRLRRLYSHGDGRAFVVPLDHSVTDGPITGGRRLNHLISKIAGGGVDAIVLHKGCLRYIDHTWFARTSVIIHLSASTIHASDPTAKYLVGNVEESLRLGADAVSVHVNIGSQQEAHQIADLAAVSEACDRWNLPLLAMMYARGPNVTNARDPQLIAHACAIAADLGADIVKTVYPGTVAEMVDITRACPIPVIVAGGARFDCTEDLLGFVAETLDAGSGGVAIGRNVFQATDPGSVARRLSSLIHPDQSFGADSFQTAGLQLQV